MPIAAYVKYRRGLARMPRSWRRCTKGTWPFGLYKMFVHFKAFVHGSVILVLTPPPAMSTLLHNYHTTSAVYDPLPTPLSYATHQTILVMAISCKGQVAILFSAPTALSKPPNVGMGERNSICCHIQVIYVSIKMSILLSLSLYIYIYVCVCIYYIYIY